MLAHAILGRGAFAGLEAWRAPLIAAAVALAAALAGRLLRVAALGFAAGGLGMLAGWVAEAGLSLHPRALPGRLPAVALVALAFAFLLERLGRARQAGFFLVVLLGAWWLGGAPQTRAAAWHEAADMVVAAAWIAASAWLLVQADLPALAASSLALWAALQAIGVGVWALLAIVPGAAALGAAAAPERPSVPPALGIGAAAAAAVIAAGRLPHAGLGPVDIACLAPLLTAWLAGRLVPRFRKLRGGAEAAGALLALALVALLAYSAAALAGLR
ncbi:MAG: hypothetical protein JO264_00635 [Acidisphaera sp.]|nr:hypothetical protein [Acidisphaera sp.]